MNAGWDQNRSDRATGRPVQPGAPPRRGVEPSPSPSEFDAFSSAEPTLYPYDGTSSFEWSPPSDLPEAEPEPAPPPVQRPVTSPPPAHGSVDETTPIPPASAPLPSSRGNHPGSNSNLQRSSASKPSRSDTGDDSIEFVADPEPGQVFDNIFRFEKAIGRGGMGSVWEVTHLGFDSPRALKLIVTRYVSDPQVRARFRREAKVMAKLQHEHAVTVHSFKVSRDLAYIEMELLRGLPLNKAFTPGQPMAVALVARLVDQLCAVLQAAHDLGIVHRDLKPANLFLLEREAGREFLKVLDFGIAKLDQPDSGVEGEDEVQTSFGAFLGTAQYASPEQIRGHKVDPRSDLYSVGVILFELLTGQRPYTGSTLDVRVKHLNEPIPRFADRAPGCRVSAEIEQVVRRCLAKEPEGRYASARELGQAFRDAVQVANVTTEFAAVADLPEPPTPAEPSRGGRTTEAARSQSQSVAPRPAGNENATNVRAMTGVPASPAGPASEGVIEFVDAPPEIDPKVLSGEHENDSLAPEPTPISSLTRSRIPRRESGDFEAFGATGAASPSQVSSSTAASAMVLDPVGPRPRKGLGLILASVVGLVAIGGVAAFVAMRPPGKADTAKPEEVGPKSKGEAPPAVAFLPAGFEAVGTDVFGEKKLPRKIKKVLRPEQSSAPEVALTFVLVEGGNFTMGTDQDKVLKRIQLKDSAKEDPTPVQNVRLSPFYLQETEVTNAQFEFYRSKAGKQLDDDRTLWSELKADGVNLDDHPAVGLPWEQCRAFAKWVSDRGDLPTEAQWEYAARSKGDPGQVFVGLGEPNAQSVNIDAEGLDGRQPTKPVGYFPKDRTQDGVLDLTGNVREWCRDILCSYPATDSTRDDPCATEENSRDVLRPIRHVIRGGSYRSKRERFTTFGPRYLQVGYDEKTLGEIKTYQAASDLGFRLVIELPSETTAQAR